MSSVLRCELTPKGWAQGQVSSVVSSVVWGVVMGGSWCSVAMAVPPPIDIARAGSDTILFGGYAHFRWSAPNFVCPYVSRTCPYVSRTCPVHVPYMSRTCPNKVQFVCTS